MQNNEITAIRKQLHATAMPMLLGDIPDRCVWELYSGNPNNLFEGCVYRATVGGSCLFKLRIAIPGITPQRMLHEMFDDHNKCNWMPNLGSSKVLDEGADDWKITYQHAKGVQGIVGDRDFVVIRFHGELKTGGFYTLCCDAPAGRFAVPPIKKCVRGELLPSGELYEAFEGDSNTCLFTYLYNVDLKGSLLKSLVNMTVGKHLLRIGQAMQGRAREVSTIVSRSRAESIAKRRDRPLQEITVVE